jgi:hypothetical protein
MDVPPRDSLQRVVKPQRWTQTVYVSIVQSCTIGGMGSRPAKGATNVPARGVLALVQKLLLLIWSAVECNRAGSGTSAVGLPICNFPCHLNAMSVIAG